MVTSATPENESPETKPTTSNKLPPGNYRLIGWDMDTTGKKLIDEICQIAAYTPSINYSQYVMPYRDLNPPAIKRHNMKVVTIGKFRALKDNKTHKILKTKSEISALMDFIAWLESAKGDATDGIILVYHEPRKVIPAMLLESLNKYNLLEKFKQTVKGFVNGFNIAEAKCASSVRTYSLRTLSRSLLRKEKKLDTAKNRASLAYEVVQYLSAAENAKANDGTGSGDSDAAMQRTIEFIRDFVHPVHVEEKEHAALKVIFERQNSLRPIFETFLSRQDVNRRERQNASPLRRLLAEAGIDYSQLQDAWTNEKKEGLEKLIKAKLSVPEKTITDLMSVLEGHFTAEKRPKYKNEKSKSNAKASDDTTNVKCESENESPDTTTVASPNKEKFDTSITNNNNEITA